MQSLKITLSAFLLFLLGACHDRIDVKPECIHERIEEFKKETDAQMIIRIDRPEGTLYWFINFHVDTGEEVLSEDCEVFCITDLEGITHIPCNGSIFSFPTTIVWEK